MEHNVADRFLLLDELKDEAGFGGLEEGRVDWFVGKEGVEADLFALGKCVGGTGGPVKGEVEKA